LPTWRAKRRHQDDAAADRSPITVTGSLRDAPDATPLKVKLTLFDDEVSLRTNEMELGSWPRSEVTITPTDGTSYAFVAEGDRLDFTPDKPTSFAESPFLARDPTPTKRRGRQSGTSRRPRSTEAQATANHDEVVARNETAMVVDDVDVTGHEPAVGRERRSLRVKQPRSGRVAPRDGIWLRTLDRARERGLFGLDRVQVDEGLRGGDHQHTFDHGTAAGYGPSKHICTICGRIKLR
jgi:hypothetical protein